jgi:pimeloyl-ACP methyl ester carboxylesterase
MDHVRMGSGEPLVLLHFQGGHAHSWEPVFELLARAHEVWALALPGSGSTPPLSEPPTMAALARAVRDFVPHETFHVAGCSLGGGVALELARQGAARTACALSPAGFQVGAEAAYLQAFLVATRVIASAAPERAPRVLARPGARRATLWSMTPHGERWPAHAVWALVRSCGTAAGYEPARRHALRERFRDGHELTCPVTVAWAEHDRLLLTGPQSARARAALPQARHTLLRGCGHLPFYDDPEQVAETVLTAASGHR